MANFCKYCGSRLDPATGQCPQCNPPKKKKRSILPGLIAILLILMVLTAGACCVLAYFEIAEIPVLSDLFHPESFEEEEEEESPADSDDEEEETEEATEEPEEETAAPTEDPAEAAYQQALDHCQTLADAGNYQELIPYLEGLCSESGDSRYQALLEDYSQIAQEHILTLSAEYAEESQYKEAALVITQAQAYYDCDAFRARLEEYTPYLTAPLSACTVLEDSNPSGRTSDVETGTWQDVYGVNHYDAVRYWVVYKSGYNSTEYAVYELNRDFVTLSGEIACSTDSDPDSHAVIEIYVDGVLAYTSPEVSDTSESASFRLDVTGAKEIRVVCTTDSSNFNYCIVDAILSEI